MRYSAKEYARALYEVLREQDSKTAEKTIKNFVTNLREHRLVALLPEILKELPAASKKVDGIEDVLIESAYEIDPATQAAALRALNKTAAQVEVTKTCKPNLIGGIRVRGRDTVFDATLKGRLQKLREALAK
ncbi:F0F1 ATP synthase subunit delta [Patescibacteria group bacterium]|nr:F0F1 ATP synthase subunit delta [Patescibacteria group bacterium]MBU1029272.1 F0F1 ATP synthase subunit delta [Patescibacteria group bacterium]MBU1915557.1 F0F1 ATP synthase subunit delta [Patescibacteria group bacterium]